MKRIKYLLLLAVVVFSLSSCKEKKEDNTKDEIKTGTDKIENTNPSDGKYYSEEYRFKVKFAGNPDVEPEQEVAKGFYVKTFMYDGGDNGDMVVAGRMDDLYAELFEGSEEELAVSIRDATLENLNAGLDKEENVTINGYPASYYEASGNFEGVDFNVKGANIIKDKFIYIIICFSKSVPVENKQYNDFVNSFEML